MQALFFFHFFAIVNCSMKTFYVTKSHTKVQKTVTVTEMTLITQWSTITHTPSPAADDETVTSTLLTYTTLDDFSYNIVEAHNNVRRLHLTTPDLVWNDSIAQSAQQYANKYNCDGILTHSKNPLYGENLALGFNTTAALEAWYDEIKYYNYDDPVFSEKTGHFTQVVWKSSSQIGCGKKYCGTYYGQYTICQYLNPGNYAKEFSENVMPLL